MDDTSICPVCRNVDGGTCRPLESRRRTFAFDCSICGRFEAGHQAFNWLTAAKHDRGEAWGLREITRSKRALISHKLQRTERNEEPFIMDDEWLEHLITEVSLPSPIVQAENMIRFIGDEVCRSGEDLAVLPDNLHATIASPSRQSAIDLAVELEERGFLRLNAKGAAGSLGKSQHPISIPTGINLTLDGWQRYEEEKQGQFAGHYGFIAMKFGNRALDFLVRDTVKPAIKDGIGYDLVDMRGVGRAGVIDNIMRAQIRDSAFVIADLSDDNLGAYWEAGYAEGLGKPVVYICEKSKFDEDSTHFDTNHCTTLFWSNDGLEQFGKELIATLRRSLDQR